MPRVSTLNLEHILLYIPGSAAQSIDTPRHMNRTMKSSIVPSDYRIFSPFPARSTPLATASVPPPTPLPRAPTASPTGFPALPVVAVTVSPTPRDVVPTIAPVVRVTPPTRFPMVEVVVWTAPETPQLGMMDGHSWGAESCLRDDGTRGEQ